MELRQLTYFVAVAEELHFGRAAARLHLASPSLSQQIRNLERDLGTPLFVRDRRHVELTPAGARFLDGAREVLAAADRAVDLVRSAESEGPLRLGYVSWLPPQVTAVTGVRILVDEWVLPSFAQEARVADGSLDLAVAWVGPSTDGDVVTADVVWHEPLVAVVPRSHPAARQDQVAAREITVLVDADDASWRSWNDYVRAFAEATGATVVHTSDSGVAGPGFFDHVTRLRRPVLSSPKRHPTPLPPTLVARPVHSPTPLWTWSLLHRTGDDRPAVARATAGLVNMAEAAG